MRKLEALTTLAAVEPGVQLRSRHFRVSRRYSSLFLVGGFFLKAVDRFRQGGKATDSPHSFSHSFQPEHVAHGRTGFDNPGASPSLLQFGVETYEEIRARHIDV